MTNPHFRPQHLSHAFNLSRTAAVIKQADISSEMLVSDQDLMEGVLYDLYYSWWEAVSWDDNASSSAKVTGENPEGGASITKQISVSDLRKAFDKAVSSGYRHCGGYGYADVDDWDACVSDTLLQLAFYGDVIFG